MHIRNIIKESFLLSFKEYKSFIKVFILALLCEIISAQFYSIKIDDFTPLIMIINSLVTLMILGIMISITYNVIDNERVEYLNFQENLAEGVKEYLVTYYYIMLTVILSSFFIIPTGVYSKITHISDYIMNMDMNTTFLTLHQINHELPLALKIDLGHSIELNLIISIFIFIMLTSFGFIGKNILFKTGNLKKSLDLRIVNQIIKNIGYKRYAKFLIVIAIIIVIIFNIIFLLEYLFTEMIISSILEAFTLFFATNAFHKLLLEKIEFKKNRNKY